MSEVTHARAREEGISSHTCIGLFSVMPRHEVAVEEDGGAGAQEVGDRLDHVPAQLPERQPRQHAPLQHEEHQARPQQPARPPAVREAIL